MENNNKTTSQPLNEALSLPSGARFYRCALQVNPFAYHGRHGKQTSFQSETEYNAAIITACQNNGIEAIAVTDHYRVADSWGLIQTAREAGIFSFGGFEAASRDGVHFLCLYDPDKDNSLERFIGQFGIHDLKALSPNGDKDCLDLLKCVSEQGGIAIAAHVSGDNGLLETLEGQPRINAWKSNYLYACALPESIDKAPQRHRKILSNDDPNYKRERPVAIINASDVNTPEDIAAPKASCNIKMTSLSIEGLRQAFLDQESRIRRNHDTPPEPHTEFVAMSWEGGFLDGTRLHFNGNLNVLIGGRGTGKSTIIESLRYVLALEPLGEEARKVHDSVVKNVLKSGTKVSLLVRVHYPTKHDYTIECTVPNPPVVKDESGNVLKLPPREVVKDVEVFGQHEISELTKSREKLTLLLERFIEHDQNTSAQEKNDVLFELDKSRNQIATLQKEIKRVEEHLTLLPGLEETEKRFKEAGLEEKLKERSILVREENIIKRVEERLASFSGVRQGLQNLLPLDTTFLSSKALEGLLNGTMLSEGAGILERFTVKMQNVVEQINKEIADADVEIKALRASWDEKRQAVETTYQSKLRELQKDKIDGDEFIKLREKIEELRPLRERKEEFQGKLDSEQANRRTLIDKWENLQGDEYRRYERAAKKVSKKLTGRVRVEVTMSGNREPLERFLREKIGGNLAAFIERLVTRESLSLRDLSQTCREGKEALVQKYSASPAAAERIAQADSDIFMRMEELELPATTKIELNTAAPGDPNWRNLESLSTGQKATAVLLLLLLESDAPLVVDQPEDDLDNRFITEGVVPIMKQEKCKRQFVFSTHNANIPVLGDAELIVGLSTGIMDSTVQGQVNDRHMGSIDLHPVREIVEEILEGGKAAFEMRRQKYGF